LSLPLMKHEPRAWGVLMREALLLMTTEALWLWMEIWGLPLLVAVLAPIAAWIHELVAQTPPLRHHHRCVLFVALLSAVAPQCEKGKRHCH
jgi:hypothetical protein